MKEAIIFQRSVRQQERMMLDAVRLKKKKRKKKKKKKKKLQLPVFFIGGRGSG